MLYTKWVNTGQGSGNIINGDDNNTNGGVISVNKVEQNCE